MQGIKLTVKAKDYYGRKVVGEKIRFEVTNGDGVVLGTQPSTTDTSGEAKATWILGYPELLQSVKVTADDAPGTQPLTFNATLDNKAPVLNVPPPLLKEVEVNKLLHFSVSAQDPDSDFFSYSVRNLPEGAIFDSEGTHEFFWQPTEDQIRNHKVTFLATDQWKAADSVVVTIAVGTPSAPVILTKFPDADSAEIKRDSSIEFQVAAYDPNGDDLTFIWYINTTTIVSFQSAVNISKCLFSPMQYPGASSLMVKITDGENEIAVQWNLIITSVTLSSFEASPKKNAIELVWRTAAESNNLGFNVLRSMNKNGPFRQINQTLIAPTSTAAYSYVDKEVQAGMTYYYKLQDVERNGAMSEHGPVSAQVALPTELVLAQNYPNPFNPATTISFELPTPQNVRLVVYNIAGQEIRTLVNESLAAGVHDIIWDARNDAGQALPTGVYYYRLYTEKEVLTKKLLLAK